MTSLEYLKFISWTALWAWIWSDTARRYILPVFSGFYKMLDEMSNDESLGFIRRKALPFGIELVVAIFWAYVLMSWSVWCVLRCVMYTQNPEANRWLFFISGFVCCELALGKVAAASQHRNFLATFPYVMAMGAFTVFSLNYDPIRTAFSWLTKFVGVLI